MGCLALVKLVGKVINIPFTIARIVGNTLLLSVGSVVYFPFFILVNILQTLESFKFLDGNLKSPMQQMVLAPFKLSLTVVNLGTYFAFPVFPIYLFFKT